MYYSIINCETGHPVFDDDYWWKTDVEGFINLSLKYRNGFDMEWDGTLRALDNTPLSVLWSEDMGFRVIQTRS